jgi:hypothetical protein
MTSGQMLRRPSGLNDLISWHDSFFDLQLDRARMSDVCRIISNPLKSVSNEE